MATDNAQPSVPVADATPTTTTAPAPSEPSAPPTSSTVPAPTIAAPSPTTTAPAPIAPANAVNVVSAVSASSAPRTPKATPGNATVALSWLAPTTNGGAAIDKYAVQRAASAAGPWTNIAFPVGLTATASGLTNGTHYSFRILAHNTAGWSAPSTVVTAVPRTVPSAPRTPKATPGNATVALSWLAPTTNGGAAIDKYAVQRAASAAGPWTNIAFPVGLTATASGLTNGTHYSFRILAHNTAGWSAPSTVVTAVPRTVPSAPRTPIAVGGDQAVNLSWTAPASTGGAAVVSYTVQWATSASGPWQFYGSAYNLWYSMSSAYWSNGTPYYFRILANNAAGSSPASAVVSAVPHTTPSMVPFCNGYQPVVGQLWMAVTWQAPANGGAAIDYYTIELWKNGSYYLTYTRPAGQLSGAFDVWSTGIYQVRVAAHNAAGLGMYCTTGVGIFQ